MHWNPKNVTACGLFAGLLGLSLIGCGSEEEFAVFPLPFPTPTSSTTPTSFEFLVVPNSKATPGSVSVRQVDLASGTTAELPGSPVQVASNSLENDPTMVVFSADQRFAYVPNANSNLISAFSLDRANSRLVAVPGSPFASGVNPTCSVAIHPNGRFLFCGGGDQVTTFSIATDTGALTPVPDSSRFIGSKGFIAPNPSLLTNNGQFLYIPGGDDGIYGFSVNAANGLLTQIPLGSQHGTVEAIALHPNGQQLCAPVRSLVPARTEVLPTVQTTDVVRSLTIQGDGTLTRSFDEPIAFTPCGVTFSQAGRLYVGSRGSSGVFGFNVNGTTGAFSALNQGQGFPAGTVDSCFPVVDPSDQFLYVSALGDNQVFGFRIGSEGNLTSVPGSPFGNVLGPAVPAVARFTR